MSAGARIVVVGVGADGWPGLPETSRAAILGADEVIGSERQLALLPEGPPRRPWPSPLTLLLDEIIERPAGTICVLASGDPMLHGIGATLAGRLGGNGRLTVLSHPSAFALACARLGWAESDVSLVSAVAQPVDAVVRVLQPGRRIVVYVTGTDGAAQLAARLCDRGFAESPVTVLEQLGAHAERISTAPAREWTDRETDPLTAVAVECQPATNIPSHSLVPGLPDDAYEHDGALTKRHVRAATLAALGPTPRALLWDVGAGSGSIAIEWLRAEPTARAIAIESRAQRAERIARNAAALGVPSLSVVTGAAPDALAGLAPPDAVFIGGGLGGGVLDAAWSARGPGGRLVANAVTLEGEQLLIAAAADRRGELTRIEVSHAEPLGGFTAWRPARPVVQLVAAKP